MRVASSRPWVNPPPAHGAPSTHPPTPRTHAALRSRVNPETQFEPIWKVVGEHWGEAPYPTLTGIGVTWLYGIQFEIKVIAKLPEPA